MAASTPGAYVGITTIVTNAQPSPLSGVRPQSFNVTAWGLRPSTTHSLLVASIDKSARAKPVGGNLGDPLVSGADGTLNFTYYYDAIIDQDVTVQLVSTTASLLKPVSANAVAISAAGAIVIQLRAPNSGATYSLPVYDYDVPLSYLGGH